MATDPKKLDEFLGTPAAPWWRRYLKWVAIGLGVLLLLLLGWRLFGASDEVNADVAELATAIAGTLGG